MLFLSLIMEGVLQFLKLYGDSGITALRSSGSGLKVFNESVEALLCSFC